MDIVQVASILSDSIYGPGAKRTVEITLSAVTLTGTLAGTDQQVKVNVSTTGDSISMGVGSGTTVQTVVKTANTLTVEDIKTYGVEQADQLRTRVLA